MTTTNFYVDIETIPTQSAAERELIAASIEAPAQYTKPESRAKWMEENGQAAAEAAIGKTSFDGAVGQVVVIGWAIDGREPESLQVADLSSSAEADMLRAFMEVARGLSAGTRWVGHNLIGFDLPFLWKRCIVHNIRPPFGRFPRNPKPWDTSVVLDTLALWDPGQRAGGSMDRLCRVLGIEGKGDMDGSKVWPMVQAGKIDEVARYCRDDVIRTRALACRMEFRPKV